MSATDTPLAHLLHQLEHHPLPNIDLKLDRMLAFLERLGNPHQRIPPVIHVAGTNGKGSVIAFLQAMLEAAGYRVHRYTSPHLMRFEERFIIAGREADAAMLVDALTPMMPLLEECPLTYFESATVLAFSLFAEHPADVTLLEVGMGGRLDATNVIEEPLATVITPIGMDHREFLGETLAAIAGEKAGIIKPGAPCIAGRQAPEALEVIESHATHCGAPLYDLGAAWQVTRLADHRLHYVSDTLDLDTPPPSLPGLHQYDNAATAIACLEQVRAQLPVSNDAMAAGVSHAVWPGRLQLLPDDVCRQLGTHHQIVVDGTHNPDAAKATAVWMQQQALPVHLVIGMHDDKDHVETLRHLLPFAASIQVVEIDGDPKSCAPDRLQTQVRQLGYDVKRCAGWQQAVDALTVTVPHTNLILISGSLYLAGEVLRAVASLLSNHIHN